MIGLKVTIIVFKILYSFCILMLTLYSIEFVIQEKQECKYDNGWLLHSVILTIFLIFTSIMVFSDNPSWTWYKLLICFFPIYITLMMVSDPNGMLEKSCSESKFLFSTLLIGAIFLPIGLGICFGIKDRAQEIEDINAGNYKTVKIHSYKHCTGSNSSHVHIMYYNEHGYIKEMKFYSGKKVSNLSEIDPKDMAKGTNPVIITENENKIEYLYQRKSGKPYGPMILYCTEYFYDNYIKNILE